MHPIYLRVLACLIMVVSLYFGLTFSQSGFGNIQEFKQLERIVPSDISGVLPGETQLNGVVYAVSEGAVLESPKAKVPSLYYRYLLEKKERDSDGDTRWVTKKDVSRAVDFVIADHASIGTTYARDSVDQIQWSMPESYHHTQGDWRYTEWRIEPEDIVLVFAWADVKDSADSNPDVSLHFDKQGAYLPIISKYSAEQVRGDLGSIAIFKIWGGVSLLTLSLFAFIYALQIHRILVFLSLLTGVSTGTLSVYGFATLVSDVSGGASHLNAQAMKSELAVRAILKKSSKKWTGWENIGAQSSVTWQSLDAWQQSRVESIRINQEVLHQVYLLQIDRFPENIFAWVLGLSQPQNEIVLSVLEKEQATRRFVNFEQTKVEGLAFWWVLAGMLAFSGFTWIGFRFAKVKRMIENVPTTSTLGVSFGIAEVKGKAALWEPSDENDNKESSDQSTRLTGPVSHLDCVWYRYLIEEHRGSGKNAKWVTISDDTLFTRFNCQDRDGALGIDPDGAEVITRHKKVKKRNSMRYSEWSIRPGDKIYTIGQANIDPLTGNTLVMGKGKQDDIFILTNYTEKELMIKKAANSMFGLGLAFSALFFAAVFFHAMNGQFSATDYLLSGLVGPVFLSFIMFVLHYNDLVFLKQRAERNWANIQVSLKKRFTLLKQLQRIVGEYQQYEHTLLKQITEQRNEIKNYDQSVVGAGNLLASEHQLLHNLKVAVEDYPELKANDLVRQFFETLTQLENEVSLMRTGYNDAVNEYNTRVQSFPDLLLASAFDFKPMDRLSFD
jgi:hypothetical protein